MAFLRQHPITHMTIFCDNAKAHKSQVLRAYCQHQDIELIDLPPYCPDLDPIEPVWKQTKRTLANKWFTSKAHFRASVQRALGSVKTVSCHQWWLERFLGSLNGDG